MRRDFIGVIPLIMTLRKIFFLVAILLESLVILFLTLDSFLQLFSSVKIRSTQFWFESF